MTAKITALASQQGITPALERAHNEFWSDLCEAIERGADAGIPIALMLGSIEYAKHNLITNHMIYSED